MDGRRRPFRAIPRAARREAALLVGAAIAFVAVATLAWTWGMGEGGTRAVAAGLVVPPFAVSLVRLRLADLADLRDTEG